jgi:hypothetical protein
LDLGVKEEVPKVSKVEKPLRVSDLLTVNDDFSYTPPRLKQVLLSSPLCNLRTPIGSEAPRAGARGMLANASDSLTGYGINQVKR